MSFKAHYSTQYSNSLVKQELAETWWQKLNVEFLQSRYSTYLGATHKMWCWETEKLPERQSASEQATSEWQTHGFIARMETPLGHSTFWSFCFHSSLLMPHSSIDCLSSFFFPRQRWDLGSFLKRVSPFFLFWVDLLSLWGSVLCGCRGCTDIYLHRGWVSQLTFQTGWTRDHCANIPTMPHIHIHTSTHTLRGRS